MLVRDYMSQPPIVISPKTPISDALKMMRERSIRRLPVVDSIVTYPAAGDSKTSVFLKVKGISKEQLTAAIRPHVESIDEIQEAGEG